MTDHPHEWRFDIYKENEKTVCRFICRHDFCDEVLEGPEVLKRLNATDRLSAVYAQLYSVHITEDPPFLLYECAEALSAYAAAREGKDA